MVESEAIKYKSQFYILLSAIGFLFILIGVFELVRFFYPSFIKSDSVVSKTPPMKSSAVETPPPETSANYSINPSVEMYISDGSQNTDFSNDTSLVTNSSIILGSESTTSPTITLPFYENENVGNTATYYLFNEQAIDGLTMTIETPDVDNFQMKFSGTSPYISTDTVMKIPPQGSAIVTIMAQTYTVL